MRSALSLSLRSVATALMVSVPLTTALASDFGSGCAGHSGETPEIQVEGLIIAGPNFDVIISGGPNLAGFLLFGATKDTWNGLPLPLELTDFGVAGCSLLVSADLVLPVLTDGFGQATLSLPSFGGFTELFMQVYLIDFDPVDFEPAVAFSKGTSITGVDPTHRQPGDLVFTEIMKDPSFVGDGFGEWFELYNTTDEDIDIDRWTLSDGGTDSLLLDSGGPLIVPAQSFVVLGNNDDPGVNGGVALLFDYSTAGTLNFSNSDDELILTTPDLVEIDRIEWDNGDLWPDEPGHSMQLAEGVFEFDLNDDGANWEMTTCYVGGAPFNTDRITGCWRIQLQKGNGPMARKNDGRKMPARQIR